MSTLTVGDIATLANVSAKTLRHYDKIGLLKPSSRSTSGYRYYSGDDVTRLHRILFYRALGLSLTEISTLLSSDQNDRVTQLKTQMHLLEAHIERLNSMRQQLAITIANEDNDMTIKNDFTALNGFDPDKYEAEAQQKWGETDAYKESKKRTKKYTQADWSRYKSELEQLNSELIAVMEAQLEPTSAEAMAVAEKMRLQIDQWFYPCSPQMHCQLGEMYVQDARFLETYEQQKEGMAQFLWAAIKANAELYNR